MNINLTATHRLDLAAAPHLLVAGATGSGKSTFLAGTVLQLVEQYSPADLRLVLIDPKGTEFRSFQRLAHLYDPLLPASKAQVITRPAKATSTLFALCRIMDGRFVRFNAVGARDIASYNEKMTAREFRIVVVIDELARLMMDAGSGPRQALQRLSQMGRAAGIHLVLATQHPSVDVIPGVIKANVPARLAFRVPSRSASQVILDESGAEALAEAGDYLLKRPGGSLCGGHYLPFEGAAETLATNSGPRPTYPVLREVNPEDFGVNAATLAAVLTRVIEERALSYGMIKNVVRSSTVATHLLSVFAAKGLARQVGAQWTPDLVKVQEVLA